MNKLSKEKRDKLLLACIGAGGTIAVLYFLVITDQKAEIAELNARMVTVQSKRDAAERLSKRGAAVQAELEAQKKILAQQQTDMPRPEEDHVWFIRIMEERRKQYNLEIADIRQPEAVEAGVLPNFPFRAVALNVSMVGSYHDFGRFLADFENSYPYMRVQMTGIGPEPRTSAGIGSSGADSDKLRFNYRVIALIKSST